MRKFLLLSTFSLIAPFVFFLSLIYFLFLSYQRTPEVYYPSSISSQRSVSYAALPTNENTMVATIQQKDARTEILSQFFTKYSSPLEPYAEYTVKMADKYGLDFRLIPSIAMQESNLCKKIPENSHNCWGFGIYGGKVTRFSGYEEAISTVSKTLSLKYKDKGLVEPHEIMTKYTPSSNGSWANGVTFFMDELE